VLLIPNAEPRLTPVHAGVLDEVQSGQVLGRTCTSFRERSVRYDSRSNGVSSESAGQSAITSSGNRDRDRTAPLHRDNLLDDPEEPARSCELRDALPEMSFCAGASVAFYVTGESAILRGC